MNPLWKELVSFSLSLLSGLLVAWARSYFERRFKKPKPAKTGADE